MEAGVFPWQEAILLQIIPRQPPANEVEGQPNIGQEIE
jgi:hypothetical protein